MSSPNSSGQSPTRELVLLVRPIDGGRFEVMVSPNGRVLGSSENEMMAIWSAVMAAEELSISEWLVHVVVERGDKRILQFSAKPRRA